MKLRNLIKENNMPNSKDTKHFSADASNHADLLAFNYKDIINKIEKKHNKKISKEQILRFLSYNKKNIKNKKKSQIEKEILDHFK